MANKSTEPAEQWCGNERVDGWSVKQVPDGAWVVLSHDRVLSMSECPCCDRPFQNARAARHVVDLVYPIDHSGQ